MTGLVSFLTRRGKRKRRQTALSLSSSTTHEGRPCEDTARKKALAKHPTADTLISESGEISPAAYGIPSEWPEWMKTCTVVTGDVTLGETE